MDLTALAFIMKTVLIYYYTEIVLIKEKKKKKNTYGIQIFHNSNLNIWDISILN